MLNTIKRYTLAAIAAAGITTGLILIPASDASASANALLSNVSVTVTTSMCPQGGSVHRTNVTITTPGTSGSSAGDTVGGLQAWSGNDLVQGSNFCQTTWYGAGYYWYWSTYRYFSFSGQHTYI
jgi:hypothetical protein